MSRVYLTGKLLKCKDVRCSEPSESTTGATAGGKVIGADMATGATAGGKVALRTTFIGTLEKDEGAEEDDIAAPC
jgi:hypothetical protein